MRTGDTPLRTVLATALLVLAFAVHAHAARNDIRWSECYPGGGTFDANLGCSGSPSATLVVGIVPPAGADHVVGFEAVIALTNPASVPYWEVWPGGCRDGAVTAGFDFTYGPYTCSDPWQGQLAGSLEIVAPPYPFGGTMLRLSGTLPEGVEVAMDPATEFVLCTVRISSAHLASCIMGCGTPACFVLENVCLRQATGQPLVCQGYHEVGTPWVLLNDPQHLFMGCMLPVPARTSTWGALKSLYR